MVGDFASVIGREVCSSSSESSNAARRALTRLVGVSINGDCGVGLLLGEPAREGFEEDMLIINYLELYRIIECLIQPLGFCWWGELGVELESL